MIHGKIRILMESHRNDLPPVDPTPTPTKAGPSPLLTPTDVVELEMQGC